MDTATKTSTCRLCDAPVLWVNTEKGKRMPLDVEPSTEGRFVKLMVGEDGVGVVHFVKDNEQSPPGKRLYSSHFQTCPERQEG